MQLHAPKPEEVRALIPEVRGWIEAACTTARQRPDLANATVEIEALARMVAFYRRNRHLEHKSSKADALPRLLRQAEPLLATRVRERRDMAILKPDRKFATMVRVQRALRAFLTQNPKHGGRPIAPYVERVLQLHGRVRVTLLKVTGRSRISTRRDGPLVAVVADALHAIDGKHWFHSSVESILRRHRPRS